MGKDIKYDHRKHGNQEHGIKDPVRDKVRKGLLRREEHGKSILGSSLESGTVLDDKEDYHRSEEDREDP